MKLGRYTGIAITSALAWASVWTSAGYVFGHVISQSLMPFRTVATPLVIVGAIVALGLAFKHQLRFAKNARALCGDGGRVLNHRARYFGS